MPTTAVLDAASALYVPNANLSNDGQEGSLHNNWATVAKGLSLVVPRGATDILSATAVRTAYTAAKALTPGGNALSATNRVCLIIPPGRYDFVTTPLVRDGEFIDWYCPGKAVFTSQVSVASHGTVEDTVQDIHTENIDFDIDSSYTLVADSTDPAAYFPLTFPLVTGDTHHNIANANEIYGITPGSRTGNLIYASIVDNGGGASWKINFYKETGRTTLIGHTANFTSNGRQYIIEDNYSGIAGYIHVDNYAALPNHRNFDQFIAANTDITIRVTGRNKFTNCNFTVAGEFGEFSAHTMRMAVEYSGDFTDCEAGDWAFGSCGFNVIGGIASGTFLRCKARDGAFGGTILEGYASGTFTFCKGRDYCFGGIAGGTFHYCEGRDWALGAPCTGVFTHCRGREYFAGRELGAYGMFVDCEGSIGSFGEFVSAGLFIRCIGGDGSFGGCATAVGFSGTAIDCIGGKSSFGDVTGATCTGKLFGCKLGYVISGVLTLSVVCPSVHGTFTGYMDGCRWEVTGSNRSALNVATGAKIHNSTLIGTGSGYSITAAAAATVEIVHCRLNKGLGANVTNSCTTPYNAVIA